MIGKIDTEEKVIYIGDKRFRFAKELAKLGAKQVIHISDDDNHVLVWPPAPGTIEFCPPEVWPVMKKRLEEYGVQMLEYNSEETTPTREKEEKDDVSDKPGAERAETGETRRDSGPRSAFTEEWANEIGRLTGTRPSVSSK